jgi:hypothetical protein
VRSLFYYSLLGSGFKRYDIAPKMMAAAWGYATGGMFVPFAAHLEAWLRDETFRPDHPHTDTASIILKGVIWAICLAYLVITLRSQNNRQSTAKPADRFPHSERQEWHEMSAIGTKRTCSMR